MNLDKKFFGGAVFVATLSAALLAACGGGGDAEPDPVDKYYGTLVSTCNSAIAVDAATNAPLYEIETASWFAKISATKAQYTTKVALYDKADCSGVARTTLTLTGADNFINVDGTETIGGKIVDKLSTGHSVYFPGLSSAPGAGLVVNGIRYNAQDYTRQTPTTGKDIAYVGTDNKITTGDFSKPLDANGYPTALDVMPSATKQ